MAGPRPFRVLCIDGGGIRGLIPAAWLAKLEDKLKKRGTGLAKSFDLICGTSTGSILAAAVATEIEMQRVIDLFEQKGPMIFRRPRWKRATERLFGVSGLNSARYAQGPLREALESVLKNKRLSEAKTRLCIPAYDIAHRAVFYFRSYDDEVKENEIWKACLASSSAPTYFPIHRVKLADKTFRYLVDGGVAANNPCGVGLAEAVNLMNKPSLAQSEKARPIQLVSLGTGSSTRNLTRRLNGNNGVLSWASCFLDVMFDASSDVSAYIAEQVLASDAYIRLQFELKPGRGSDDLDDASANNLEELFAAAENYLSKGGSRAFNEITNMLLPRKAPGPPAAPRVVPLSSS